MRTLFDLETKEGNIHLEKVDKHTLSLVINGNAFSIEGYPIQMVEASVSVLERDESLLKPFKVAGNRGQISHLSGKDIYIFSINKHEASLEGDELELLINIISQHTCV